ncbi:hypothetical protein B23_3788 [Geobacillus thermoleovorans B23]|nr:hypothetical protein B23_3788 [Geobacillus thermoleovorans B23]
MTTAYVATRAQAIGRRWKEKAGAARLCFFCRQKLSSLYKISERDLWVRARNDERKSHGKGEGRTEWRWSTHGRM